MHIKLKTQTDNTLDPLPIEVAHPLTLPIVNDVISELVSWFHLLTLRFNG